MDEKGSPEKVPGWWTDREHSGVVYLPNEIKEKENTIGVFVLGMIFGVLIFFAGFMLGRM